VTVYTTDIIVDRIDFPVGGGKQEKKEATEEQERIPEFIQISEDEIPF